MPIIPADLLSILLLDNETFRQLSQPDAKKTFLEMLKYEPEKIFADVRPHIGIAIKAASNEALTITEAQADAATEEIMAALRKRFSADLKKTARPSPARKKGSIFA